MRVVITGHNGQLGRQLQAAFSGHDILPLDLPCDDITDPGVVGCIVNYHPDLVINSAAYTDVDGAEQNPDLAFRVNTIGAKHAALGA